MEGLDVVYNTIYRVVSVCIGIFVSQFGKKKSLFLRRYVYRFTGKNIRGKSTHKSATTLVESWIFSFSITVFAKQNPFVFFSDAYKIFNEIDGFENWILFSP